MNKKITNAPEVWDDGLLGSDEQYVAVAGPEHDDAVDRTLSLKSISIRLPESLIDDFKYIASTSGGMGYQTLMRQVLKRFAETELNVIVKNRRTD